MQIFINKFHKDNKLEKFLDDQFEVYSRSGLNETEKRLIAKLPELNEPKNILILENRTGVAAMIASLIFPAARIVVQNLDKYYCDKVEHNLEHNGLSTIEVRCEPDIYEEWDAILYQQTRPNLIKELVFDLIQQSHKALKKNAKLFLALEQKEKLITEKMQQIFGGATLDHPTDKGVVLIGKKKNKPVEYFDYSDKFDFMDNEKLLVFNSVPGVFAHHRIDEGAKALLNLVELQNDDTLLDMGCGIGSIGIPLAKRRSLKHIYFVDSNCRALKMTAINCMLNAVDNYQTELSAAGFHAPSRCQLVTANPPYFSDYKIANIFVETAFLNLIKGGKAWFVARNPLMLSKIMNDRFKNCRESRHHGYSVLVSSR
jgi:16S rRNA (guanine1207-N2)-methyltransferase